MPAHESARPRDHIRVADVEIDVGARRVWRAGRRLRIAGLTLDLLLELARSAPATLSVHELLERVWPGRVVNPETVSQRVKPLRAALGDDSRDPRYIGVERGHGYRLLVPVRHAPSGGHPAANGPGMVRPTGLWILVIALVLSSALLIRMYEGGPAGIERGSAVPEASLFQPPANAVAVLPFENLGDAGGTGFPGRSLAEAVLHRLANQRDLAVIARTSSFAIPRRSDDVRAIGRALNARYLLEGSVQQSDDQLRVFAQLVDTVSGVHLWSRRYDRVLGDIFTIQHEIAADVAGHLELSLKERIRPSRPGTPDLEAYLAYLRGRELLMKWQVAGVRSAAAQFDRAIALDSEFADALVSRAEAYLIHANMEGDLRTVASGVESLLVRALELDPELGEAYILRANLIEDPAVAERLILQGLELSPNSARGYERYANFLIDAGRPEEALAAIDRAIALGPLTARNHYIKGLCLWMFTGRAGEAEELFMHALELDPEFHPALMRIAQLRWWHGAFAEAVSLGEQSLALDPRSSWVRFGLARMYLDLDDRAAAAAVLDTGKRWIGEVLLPLHVGDRDRADAVAREFSNPASLDQPHAAIAAAVRDRALARGTPQEALAYLAERPGILPDGPVAATGPRELLPYLPLVSLLQADGQKERAALVIDRLRERLAEIDARQGGPGPMTARLKARLYALADRPDEALAALEQAFDGGAMVDWVYDLRYNPTFDRLRDSPRFRDLVRTAAGHAADEAAELERLRVAGRGPLRSAAVQGLSYQ